jgi:hypothetical protein
VLCFVTVVLSWSRVIISMIVLLPSDGCFVDAFPILLLKNKYQQR